MPFGNCNKNFEDVKMRRDKNSMHAIGVISVSEVYNKEVTFFVVDLRNIVALSIKSVLLQYCTGLILAFGFPPQR